MEMVSGSSGAGAQGPAAPQRRELRRPTCFLRTGPDIEPNLWMWVNPNIVFPPGKLEVSQPRTGAGPTSTRPAPPLPPGEGDCARCPQAGVGARPPASSGRSPPPEQPPAPSSSEVGA